MNKKALVIEDDKNIAELLRLYLEKDGFEVAIAADGGKGLQLATDEHPDVILLDIELLYHLAASPNRVYTRNQLLDEVWGFDYFGDSRTVDVHIKRLREKLEGVSDKWSLKTVWGVGYKFEVSGS